MEPLYDQSGEVYSWMTRQTGRIVDLLGRHVAFVEGENVYNWSGQHIGWWQKQHIRNHDGDVAVFLHRARDFGLIRPVLAMAPRQPTAQPIPTQPVRAPPLTKAACRLAWAQSMPF